MALNRALVSTASAVLLGVGSKAPVLAARLSSDCTWALKLKMPDSAIKAACGPGFGNGTLVWIIGVGFLAGLCIYFWRDIGQFFVEKFTAKE